MGLRVGPARAARRDPADAQSRADRRDHDRRGAVSRSDYVEHVLAAALEREHPHLPDGWTPERAAAARFARVQRFLATGR